VALDAFVYFGDDLIAIVDEEIFGEALNNKAAEELHDFHLDAIVVRFKLYG